MGTDCDVEVAGADEGPTLDSVGAGSKKDVREEVKGNGEVGMVKVEGTNVESIEGESRLLVTGASASENDREGSCCLLCLSF